MNRQEANKQILKRITEMVENQPDMRFNQILFSLGINKNAYPFKLSNGKPDYEKQYCEDLFGEESVKTLKRMNGDNG